MNDRQILDLFFARDEAALAAVSKQYGRACRNLAAHLLHSEQDAEEVLNDALMQIWNAIPPARPDNFYAYLTTVVRNLCYKRLDQRNAQKRGGGQAALSLENLPEHAQPARNAVEETVGAIFLNDAVNRFLQSLSPDACTIFVQRYGNGKSIAEIADMYQISRNKAALSLMRTRIKLKKYLNEEGWL